MVILLLILIAIGLTVIGGIFISMDDDVKPFGVALIAGALALVFIAGQSFRADCILDRMTKSYTGNQVITYDSVGVMTFIDSTSYQYRLYEYVQGWGSK